ncbi:MAG TPA: cell wall-active antibiotics response protein LiaF [Virgibacillus sp.]|nr:cell wall-active antibiotics response protein LiaF [Virgibacillus sp.]
MRHNIFRYLLAVILIGIGILLVLENFGFGTFSGKNMWILLYPLLFIVYGIKTLVDHLRYRGGSWIFGSFLLIFGSLLMLDRFGVISFVFKDIFKLWPLLIIYLGFAFIRPKRIYHHNTKGRRGKHGYYYGPYDYTKYFDADDYRKQAHDQADYYKKKYRDVVYDATDDNGSTGDRAADEPSGDESGPETKEHSDTSEKEQSDENGRHTTDKQSYSGDGKAYYRNSFFSIGNSDFNENNWKVEPMHLSKLAGDFYLDFTKAFIPDKKIPISINTLAGDVRILVPEDIDFRVNAEVKAGDINILGHVADGINRSLQYETDDYNRATRKLDMTLKLKAGSVRIDHV